VREQTYRVVVTREDEQWLADVPELLGAHTHARSLPTLDQAVREVIVLAADLPDEAIPDLVLGYEYHTGDPELDTTALEVRRCAGRPTSSPPPHLPVPVRPPPSLSAVACPFATLARCWESVPSASRS
jgi:predicted RNase H-like HicB family nuclease